MEKILNNYIEDFKEIFTTTKVSNYFSNKDKIPHELKSNVVYEYKYFYDKSIQYFGFNSRPFVERVKEIVFYLMLHKTFNFTFIYCTLKVTSKFKL